MLCIAWISTFSVAFHEEKMTKILLQSLSRVVYMYSRCLLFFFLLDDTWPIEWHFYIEGVFSLTLSTSLIGSASTQWFLSDNINRTAMDVFETSSSILMLVWGAMGILCALLFILIVSLDRRCHTLTILLVLNSTVAGLLANIVCISQAIYQLMNVGPDPLCAVRGLLLQAGTGLLYHTLCVQALYRLFVTVYSTRRALQTRNFIVFLMAMQWVISGIFGLPMLLMDRIKYHQGSRICQVDGFLPFLSLISLASALGFPRRQIWFLVFRRNDIFTSVADHWTDLSRYCQIHEKESIRYDASLNWSGPSPSPVWTSSDPANSHASSNSLRSRLSLLFLLRFCSAASHSRLAVHTASELSIHHFWAKCQHLH